MTQKVDVSSIDETYDEGERRSNGAFFTPKNLVDFSHERVSKTLGEDWKSNYIVWDNSAGTCNLTRDYTFSELYISTLMQSELDLGMQYNKEAVHFQFDFLNDEIPEPGQLIEVKTKLPSGLVDALKNDKPIVFYMNPPYSRINGQMYGIKRRYQEKSNIQSRMKDEGYTQSSAEFVLQFLYRILKIKRTYNLTQCYIAMFSPATFLTGSHHAFFRKEFFKDFELMSACMFPAGLFSGTSSLWGVGFTVWKTGVQENKEAFPFEIYEYDKKENVMVKNGVHNVYNLDNLDNRLMQKQWVHEPIKNLKTHWEPNLTSALKVKDDVDSNKGTIIDNHLGYYICNTNEMLANIQKHGLFSSPFSNAHGFSINKDNFDRVASSFAIRNLIKCNWINSKDQYIAPDTNHPKYKEFLNDSFVYCLFSGRSSQSSLRQIKWRDKLWDIKNEYFWMSKTEMIKLAKEYNNTALLNDVLASEERYMYTRLQNVELSKEAKDVLDFCTQLVRKSFKYRQEFDKENKHYHINTWDAGFYQLKALWKEYLPDDYIEFQRLFSILSEKMQPIVYELGCLLR